MVIDFSYMQALFPALEFTLNVNAKQVGWGRVIPRLIGAEPPRVVRVGIDNFRGGCAGREKIFENPFDGPSPKG